MSQALARIVEQQAVPRRTDAAAGTSYYYPGGGDTGTSTGSNTTTTLNDTNKNWTPNSKAGKCVICTSGAVAILGIPRRIKSNTATQLVLFDAVDERDPHRGPFASVPTTSTYFIVNLDGTGNYLKYDQIIAELSVLAFTGTSLDVCVEYTDNYGIAWTAIADLTFAQKTDVGSGMKRDVIEYPGLWRVKAVIVGDPVSITWQLDWFLIKR
jgi:hypothetical protein